MSAAPTFTLKEIAEAFGTNHGSDFTGKPFDFVYNMRHRLLVGIRVLERFKPKAEPVVAAPEEQEPHPGLREALDKLDSALLFLLAGTVNREGAGTDAHNVAIATKAATDIRALLQTGAVYR